VHFLDAGQIRIQRETVRSCCFNDDQDDDGGGNEADEKGEHIFEATE
jgi:hypothetical protein